MGVLTFDTRRLRKTSKPDNRKVEIEKDDVVVVNLTDVDTFLSEISRMNVETLGLEHQFD